VLLVGWVARPGGDGLYVAGPSLRSSRPRGYVAPLICYEQLLVGPQSFYSLDMIVAIGHERWTGHQDSRHEKAAPPPKHACSHRLSRVHQVKRIV
jgi:hypothetical protein